MTWQPDCFDYTALRDDYVRTPSGLILPLADAEARYLPKKLPTVIDLFCGAGGTSCGLKQAGWHVIAAVDNDPAAAVTYMTNLCRYGEFGMHFVEEADKWRLNEWIEKDWKRERQEGVRAPYVAGSGWICHQPRATTGTANFVFGDIRKLTGKRLLDIVGMKAGAVDCIAASPPCQGFSRANPKRNAHNPRNSLIWEWLRLVLEVQPKTIIMENVPGIATMTTPDGVPVIDQIARVLEDGSFATIDALRRTIKQQTGPRSASCAASRWRRRKRRIGARTRIRSTCSRRPQNDDAA